MHKMLPKWQRQGTSARGWGNTIRSGDAGVSVTVATPFGHAYVCVSPYSRVCRRPTDGNVGTWFNKADSCMKTLTHVEIWHAQGGRENGEVCLGVCGTHNLKD